MTFSAPRVPPVLETQKVMVNEIEETPVACVQFGENMNEPPGGDPDVVRTIGTVTITGDTNAQVGDTDTYTATISGNAVDGVFAFSGGGETYNVNGRTATVTWANAGAPTTITCTVTSATATDSGASGTLDVTVAAAATGIGNVTVTSDGGNNRRAGVAQTFTAASDGTASDITWSWGASADGVVTGTGATVTVIWPGTNASRAGTTQTVTATATSPSL